MIKHYIVVQYDGTYFIIVKKKLNVRECTSLYRITQLEDRITQLEDRITQLEDRNTQLEA